MERTLVVPLEPAAGTRIEVVKESVDERFQAALAEMDADSPLAHPFQTQPFAALFNTDPSREPFLITASDAGGLMAYWRGYFAQYHSGFGPKSYAWLRSGPVIRKNAAMRREDVVAAMIPVLKAYLRRERVGWVIFTSEALYGGSCEACLKAQGFARHDLQTYLIDLSSSEEELSARLDQRARWSANRARRNDIDVSDAASDSEVMSYYQVYLESGSTPGYNPPSPDEFLRGFRRLRDEGKGRLIVARFNGEVIAGSFFPCHSGFAAQHQHAVRHEARKLNAGSLLIWESILSFKRLGYRALDLVSVDVAPPPGSREAGVRDFKAKWGGELMDTPVYQYWTPGLRILRSLRRKISSMRRSPN